MAKIFYGTDEVTQGWDRYFGVCNLLEIPHNDEAAPTLKTLNSWRVKSPKGFAFAIHATPEVVAGLAKLNEQGVSELDANLREAWTTTLERAHALAAKAIIVETPFDFAPSTNSRALITAFGDELASDFRGVVIWASHGVWPPESTRDLAEAHSMAYLLDPFIAETDEVPFTSGDAAFEVTERGGMRRHFDQYDMEKLIEWTRSYNRVFVLMRGQHAFRHIKELHEALKYAE